MCMIAILLAWYIFWDLDHNYRSSWLLKFSKIEWYNKKKLKHILLRKNTGNRIYYLFFRFSEYLMNAWNNLYARFNIEWDLHQNTRSRNVKRYAVTSKLQLFYSQSGYTNCRWCVVFWTPKPFLASLNISGAG